MSGYYISLSDFKRILEKLLERSAVFAPINSFDRVYFERIEKDLIDKIVYQTPREIDPPKSVIYLAREIVEKYFEGAGETKDRPVTIVGIKGCDAAALCAYDKVLLDGDTEDPLYKKRTDSLFLIGTDCADAYPTCFCTLVGLNPFPEKKVDINLSAVEKGFVVEPTSEKGRAFMDEFSYFFRNATIEEQEEARLKRLKTISKLSEINQGLNYKLPIHEIIKGTIGSPAWRKITRFCTECGACNIACPTCTCFTLFDQRSDEGGFERVRIWDACLKGKYARVAGGANSRPMLSERYNNRLQCKFDYSFERTNMYTCTGCGRCIEACPAKIDMRQSIKELEAALALSAKLE